MFTLLLTQRDISDNTIFVAFCQGQQTKIEVFDELLDCLLLRGPKFAMPGCRSCMKDETVSSCIKSRNPLGIIVLVLLLVSAAFAYTIYYVSNTSAHHSTSEPFSQVSYATRCGVCFVQYLIHKEWTEINNIFGFCFANSLLHNACRIKLIIYLIYHSGKINFRILGLGAFLMQIFCLNICYWTLLLMKL